MRTIGFMAGIGAAICLPASAMAQAPDIPANLSVGGMFMAADWIVKLVMIGLLIASLVTWTVFVAKVLELRKATANQQAIHDGVIALRSLGDAKANSAVASSPLVREAGEELALSADALSDTDGIKERVVSRFERHEAAEARRMTRGVNVVATIGATAPFVGLFGTVWGIMTSFAGIAEAQDTSLAVVAPGIAEALAATAYGLAAAIPATIGFNRIGAAFGRLGADLSDHVDQTAVRLVRLAPGALDAAAVKKEAA